MILTMWRKFVAILVILGWVSLSGFDVIEDLDALPSQGAVSKSSPDGSATAKRSMLVPRVNNMVESATRPQQIEIALDTSIPDSFHVASILDFRRHLQIHKFFRVLLI